ncbi:MAG: potassium-transporting ATPase subunit KdpC [Bdellovibrionales bacterium]
MFQEIRSALGLLIFFTILTGIAYPLLMTTTGQWLFPHQANGSLVEVNGKIIGSELIGQKFSSDKYFHSRPSSAGNGYDAANSSGSNLSPTSKKLMDSVSARVADLRKSGSTRPIPVDLVTASGSGLDPDISVESANFQAQRIAQTRGLSLQEVENLISINTAPRTFGVLGEKRVNVLAINRALDLLPSVPQTSPVVP